MFCELVYRYLGTCGNKYHADQSKSLTQKVVAGGERLLRVRRRDIRQHPRERARCADCVEEVRIELICGGADWQSPPAVSAASAQTAAVGAGTGSSLASLRRF